MAATIPISSAVVGWGTNVVSLKMTFHPLERRWPPEQFTGLSRPLFQEDEWKLILVGAVLGSLVGVGQSLLL